MLVHTGENGSVNPALLVEAGDDDGHTGPVVRIDFHRFVQRAVEIPGQQKQGGDDAVGIQKRVVFKIDHTFAAHQHHQQADEKQQQTGTQVEEPVLVVLGVGGQIFGEAEAGAGAAIQCAAADEARAAVYLHFVAFRHTSGRNAEVEGNIRCLPQRVNLRLCFQLNQNAGIGNILAGALEPAALFAGVQIPYFHGETGLEAGAGFPVFDNGVQIIHSGQGAPPVKGGTLPGGIRYIRQAAPVPFFTQEHIPVNGFQFRFPPGTSFFA